MEFLFKVAHYTSQQVYSFTHGQTYKSLVAEADNFYQNKEYKKAVDKFKVAFEIEQKSAGDIYNASCTASLLGDKNLAFEWLNSALKNGWANVRHLKTDSDLNSLHEDERWNNLVTEMQKEVSKKEANYDKPLQTTLLAIFDDDQMIRQQFITAQKEFGHDSKKVDSLGTIMILKDSINLIKVTEILDNYGWMGIHKIGGQANQTLFLVIQHSDLKTQQKYLPMMREAVKTNNASASSLALLEDRVALEEGKRQIYGSQIGYDEDTEKSYVLPLQDPENVDKRRMKVGLEPMSVYVKGWDITWDAKRYKKVLPALEKKLKGQK